MRCVAWYCACFLILFCLGSSPRSVSHSLSCSSSAASDSSQSLSGSGNVVSRSSSSSGGLLLFADAQILHDALSDVEREEARLQEEAAIAAGRGHRLGALYQQRRAQQRRRRQRARDGSRPLPRAPALVRIDPHSGAEEAFVAPAPAQRSIRIPKRRGIPGRGGGSGSGSSRSPSQQGRTKRLRATSISQAHEQQPQQQQTPAGPQTTEENQHQQITQGQDQLQQQQLQQSEQEQPTQQHQELSEQQQQQQQQQQPGDPSLDRDPRTANDTSASTDAAATSDFTDPSMGPEELARAGMFEPGLVGRLGAVRSESRHQVEQAYFGQSVVSKVLDDSSPLASPSRSSATAVALMVLVPLIGLAVFYAVYSVMEGRRVRHGSWENDLAAQDSINSAAARGAAGASSVPFRGGSVAGAGGAGHKPKGKGKESAATRARRALGELDADDDWEVPLCIDDVERGADDGL